MSWVAVISGIAQIGAGEVKEAGRRGSGGENLATQFNLLNKDVKNVPLRNALNFGFGDFLGGTGKIFGFTERGGFFNKKGAAGQSQSQRNISSVSNIIGSLASRSGTLSNQDLTNQDRFGISKSTPGFAPGSTARRPGGGGINAGGANFDRGLNQFSGPPNQAGGQDARLQLLGGAQFGGGAQGTGNLSKAVAAGNFGGGGGGGGGGFGTTAAGNGNAFSNFFKSDTGRDITGTAIAGLGEFFGNRGGDIPRSDLFGQATSRLLQGTDLSNLVRGSLQNVLERPDPKFTPLSEKFFDVAVRKSREDEDRAVDQARTEFKRVRPGANIANDSGFRNFIGDIRQKGRDERDATRTEFAANQQKEFEAREDKFFQNKVFNLQNTFKLENEQIGLLAKLAQMDEDALVNQFALERGEASRFKELFSEIGEFVIRKQRRS